MITRFVSLQLQRMKLVRICAGFLQQIVLYFRKKNV
jgi:hypothetical protein